MATVRTLIGNVKGPKGDTGETGAKGDTGTAATITVGSTTTSAAGTAAQVQNVGTENNAVLNFTIPQGPPGSIGEIYSYRVNAITSQSGQFPVPAVGDTIAQVVGKQVKTTQDIQTILGDFATVESAATASKAYAVGDYLVYNGQFYKVTAAISAGNTLSVGGNIQATNVGAEVSALNNDLAKLNTYESSETAIGKWIDGSTIYRNVLQSVLPSVASAHTIGHVSNLRMLVSARFIIHLQGSFFADGAIYASSTYTPLNVGFVRTNGEVIYKSNVPSYFGANIYAIIEYVKQ